MKRILVLGANGALARNTTNAFLRDTDVQLTLYLRKPGRLLNPDPKRVAILEGDVLDPGNLRRALERQDVVYANLSGELKRQAETIVAGMMAVGPKRLIFVSAMGIYGEIPDEPYKPVLDPYRDAAAVIEASGLDYTILRPGWFLHTDEVAYGITQKGDPFVGKDVSINSLSHLIVKLATTPGMHSRCSLGVSRG